MKTHYMDLHAAERLQLEIETLAHEFFISEHFLKGKSIFGALSQFELEYLITRLWLYFALIDLPAQGNYTIWGYLEKKISLIDFANSKISILNNWDKGYLFARFREFMAENSSQNPLRIEFKIRTSYETIAIWGKEWMERLCKDEKDNAIAELEDYRKAAASYFEIYEIINNCRLKGLTVEEGFCIAVEKYQGKHAALDELLLKHNGDLKNAFESLKRAYYSTDYKLIR